MPDFRLHVFLTVARHLSFTKAAQELFISQPAITKHIRELESSYDQRLFVRRGSRITLTDAGQALLAHATAVEQLDQQLHDTLLVLRGTDGGLLRLGASTTLTQYVLPRLLPGFRARYPHAVLSLRNGNSEQIAGALLDGHIDLGFVEGRSKSRDLHYELLLEDELVIVRRARKPAPKPLPLAELIRQPLVLRERGSGTLEVVEHALRAQQVKLNELTIALQLPSTEAIKTYLSAAPEVVAFLSKAAVAPEVAVGVLEIVPVPELSLKREFEAVWMQGQPLAPIAAQFLRFAKEWVN